MIRKLICGFLFLLGMNSCKINNNCNEKKNTKNLTLSYFGEITKAPARDYETVIQLGADSILLDLSFYNKVVSESSLRITKLILNDLPSYINKSNEILAIDFKNGGPVKDYIEHHLEDLPKTELTRLNSDLNKNELSKKQLLSILKIESISFYPDDIKHHMLFYFSIGSNLTNYKIVIRYNNMGDFESLEFVS